MFFCQSQSTLVALSRSLHACNAPAQGLAKRSACEKLNPTRAAPAREPASKFLTFLYCARVLSASGRLHPSKHAKKATLHYKSMTCTPSELTKNKNEFAATSQRGGSVTACLTKKHGCKSEDASQTERPLLSVNSIQYCQRITSSFADSEKTRSEASGTNNGTMTYALCVTKESTSKDF